MKISQDWIACDVDDTLLREGMPNPAVVLWLRKKHAAGHRLILWSARGSEHAQTAAQACEIAHLFTAIIGKPGLILDDLNWGWIKYTEAVRWVAAGMPAN